MKHVAILGLGLMGGSLGLALKRRGLADCVSAYARRAETRARALDHGMVDEAFDDPEAAVRDADLTVVCVPILATVDLIRRCRAGLKPGAIVTDVGSTKVAVAQEAEEAVAGTGTTFIGSHPIAGSEQQGIESAREVLYDNAWVVVTPRDAGADAAETERLADFWRSVGGRTQILAAARHDEVLARTSHLPHMVAVSLAATVGRGDDVTHLAHFCGTGFRDTTRIAGGSPEVWLDILRTNRQNVVQELTAFRNVLDELIRQLQGDEFKAVEMFLKQTQAVHEALTRDVDTTG